MIVQVNKSNKKIFFNFEALSNGVKGVSVSSYIFGPSSVESDYY